MPNLRTKMGLGSRGREMASFSKEFNKELITFWRVDFFSFLGGSAAGSKIDDFGWLFMVELSDPSWVLYTRLRSTPQARAGPIHQVS